MARPPSPRTLALALLLAAALPAATETFLVVVSETDDGQPSSSPLAAREGIFSALFEADHIGFEVPADWPPQPMEELRRLARAAGAGVVATIVVDWHQESLSGGAQRISARGSIVVHDALTERETARVTFAVGNEGRERTADRSQLGLEIGTALVGAFRSSAAGR
jgi:hypothetical protein